MSTIKNLKVSKGQFQLEIDNWVLPDKGISALVGPSGSGKTTCLKVLLGLEVAPGFEWIWDVEGSKLDISKVSFREKRFGVVFQDASLFPHMTVAENIAFAGESRGLSKQEIAKESEVLLNRLGVINSKNKKAAVLSGGEAQRVALARAVIGSPRFLFLDEPFSALDAVSKGEARNLVKEVVNELEIPTLMISHDKEDVALLASQVFQIENGKLKQ